MASFGTLGTRGFAAVAGVVAIVLVAASLSGLPDTSLPLVFAVAVALGFVFVWQDFGFTAGFRQFLADGDGRALGASFAVPAVASLIVIPVGSLIDGYSRFTAPVGVSLIAGAFMFGIGM